MTITIQDLKHEFRSNYHSDEWGNTLGWLFNICDILMFERGTNPPDKWQYRPSIMGSSIDESDSDADFLREVDTTTLIEFGWLLHRFCYLLKRAGKEY